MERERHTSGLMVLPNRREALGVTDSRSSSDVESKIFNDKLFFKENLSVSWLITTLLGSSRLLDFLDGDDLRALRLLPQ